jgi:hypothetical protein
MKKFLFLMLTMSLSTSFLSAQQRVEEKGFDLKWETQGDKLVLTLKAETKGWIAFGIDAESVMKDANIIILWVDDKTGIAMAEDHYGTGRFAHKSDIELGGTQDFQVLSGTQTDTHTEVTFTIPLDSGDEYDKPLERGKTYRLLLASNKSDKISSKHNNTYAQDIEIR